MPKVFTVYTKANCQWCDKAKALLTKCNIEYRSMEVHKDILREDFIARLPKHVQARPTAPQIFDQNDNYIGTYEDLVEYLDEYLN